MTKPLIERELEKYEVLKNTKLGIALTLLLDDCRLEFEKRIDERISNCDEKYPYDNIYKYGLEIAKQIHKEIYE